jgi:hypothetical protein
MGRRGSTAALAWSAEGGEDAAAGDRFAAGGGIAAERFAWQEVEGETCAFNQDDPAGQGTFAGTRNESAKHQNIPAANRASARRPR